MEIIIPQLDKIILAFFKEPYLALVFLSLITVLYALKIILTIISKK